MQATTGTTMTLAHNLLQRIHQQLLAEQAGLHDRLQRTDAAAGGEVHDTKDEAEQSSRLVIADHERLHAELELANVTAALRRLDTGLYGVCLDCGEPIEERRLLALPAAPICATCQRVRESEAAFQRG
jgi:DnaK suppressor protein